MDTKDLWWKQRFLESEYGTNSYIDHESCILPFKEFKDRIEIGFIGPYSLAYAETLSINESAIIKTWQMLIDKFSNKEIHIRLPPEEYYPKLFVNNFAAITKLNGSVIYSDLNQYLELSGKFELKIRRNRIRDLKKSIVSGQVVKQIEIFDAYSIIEKNRIRKNLVPTVKVEKIIHLSKVIPNAINSFGVYERNDLIAASIVYKISNSLAYVFMWGHDPDTENGGLAVTSLCKGLFDYYQNESVEILCLGTSSVRGQVDFGLMDFKKGLGAIISERKVIMIPKSKL